jgi:hypothetical protein
MNSTPCAKQSVFKNVSNRNDNSIEIFDRKEYNIFVNKIKKTICFFVLIDIQGWCVC